MNGPARSTVASPKAEQLLRHELIGGHPCDCHLDELYLSVGTVCCRRLLRSRLMPAPIGLKRPRDRLYSARDNVRDGHTQNGIDTLTGELRMNGLWWSMKPISYAHHRFPPDVIRHAVWLYLRFTLSYRDVEDLLAERGLEVSNESIRRWVLKFGSAIAKNLRSIRPRPHDQWHLDEMVVSIGGRRMYMWRAVDSEGEVLDVLVQRRRDQAAALKLLRKLLKKQGFVPAVIVSDKLGSYRAALRTIGFSGQHEQGFRANNRAENSHQPVRLRERKMGASNHPSQFSALFRSTPLFTTPSMFNDA